MRPKWMSSYNQTVIEDQTMQATSTAPALPLIEGDELCFRREFNQKSFWLRHHLAGHPLFTLPRLLQFANTVAQKNPQDLHYDTGDVGINQRWAEIPQGKLPIDEAIRRIAEEKAWIFFKWSDNDDQGYTDLLHECLSQIQRLTGVDLPQVMRIREAILFITSPNRITTYHVDRECNFLLQLQGCKTIHVFDQNDRDVLTESELEHFWTVDNNYPRYKEQYEDRATLYHLTPGDGVHLPVNAPHWLQNDNNVSITLSVNFTFRNSMRADIYRANYYLRKLGLQPAPPGYSGWRDNLKSSLMGSAIATRNLYERLSGRQRQERK